jgi:hypothetical protein
VRCVCVMHALIIIASTNAAVAWHMSDHVPLQVQHQHIVRFQTHLLWFCASCAKDSSDSFPRCRRDTVA